MTATLEPTDVFQTAFVVIDVDDYLDVRRPAWIVLEKAGAVGGSRQEGVREPGVVGRALHRLPSFPAKYTVHGKRK